MSRLCLFPSHRQLGSHVPYKSLVELRAADMPDAAWSVSGHPPSSSRRTGQPPVLTSSNPLSTLLQRFACARLSQPCLSESSPTFPQRSRPLLLTTAACGGLRSAPDCRPRRTSLHLSYSYAAPFGPAILVTQDPFRTWSERTYTFASFGIQQAERVTGTRSFGFCAPRQSAVVHAGPTSTRPCGLKRASGVRAASE